MLACSHASATAGVLAYGRNRQQIDRGFRLNRLVHSQTLTLVDKLQVLSRRYSLGGCNVSSVRNCAQSEVYVGASENFRTLQRKSQSVLEDLERVDAEAAGIAAQKTELRRVRGLRQECRRGCSAPRGSSHANDFSRSHGCCSPAGPGRPASNEGHE